MPAFKRSTLSKPKKKRTPKVSVNRQGQFSFFAKESLSYGGALLKTRKGRSRGRPLDTKNGIHLVIRSSKAKGEWSFKKPRNEHAIKHIVAKFSLKHGVSVLSLGNAGNHLHFHIKLTNRGSYKPFIRAVTSAIMMKVTGLSRWSKKAEDSSQTRGKFWDLRPFTRVLRGYKSILTLNDYILLNEMEGEGVRRHFGFWIIQNQGRSWALDFLKTAPG